MDSLNRLALIVVAVLLVLMNGFFVAAEFAVVKTRLTHLDELIRKGFSSARVARKLCNEMDATLSATQLGVTLASLGLGWVGEPAFAHLIEGAIGFGPWSVAIAHTISLSGAFLVITLLHIVFGELTPKYLAIQKSERVLLWVARPVRLFYWITYPLILFLRAAAVIALRLVGIKPGSRIELAHSEE